MKTAILLEGLVLAMSLMVEGRVLHQTGDRSVSIQERGAHLSPTHRFSETITVQVALLGELQHACSLAFSKSLYFYLCDIYKTSGS